MDDAEMVIGKIEILLVRMFALGSLMYVLLKIVMGH